MQLVVPQTDRSLCDSRCNGAPSAIGKPLCDEPVIFGYAGPAAVRALVVVLAI